MAKDGRKIQAAQFMSQTWNKCAVLESQRKLKKYNLCPIKAVFRNCLPRSFSFAFKKANFNHFVRLFFSLTSIQSQKIGKAWMKSFLSFFGNQCLDFWSRTTKLFLNTQTSPFTSLKEEGHRLLKAWRDTNPRFRVLQSIMKVCRTKIN